MSEADLCVVGDQHNWKYAWLTEHHFLTEYSHISANEVLAPHVLARTEKHPRRLRASSTSRRR